MSDVYQSASGQWIFFDGTTKHFFDTQQEAVQMAGKQEYAQVLQGAATAVAQAANIFADGETVYFDRGYNGGGGNAITDEDLAGLGITANDLAGLITFGQQLNNLLNGQATTPGDYDSTLNKLRTDM